MKPLLNPMNVFKTFCPVVLLSMLATPSQAFTSGSTGADGALNVTTNTTLALPPGGVFNFTTITIAAGKTLKFNTSNQFTPVYLLATGNVNIHGTIDVSGGSSVRTDDANKTNDTVGGKGGPGGFDGGRGGFAGVGPDNDGTLGQGPGGGQPGVGAFSNCSRLLGVGGGGGGYRSSGTSGVSGGAGGGNYGVDYLIPLIGGSGGGGGSGNDGTVATQTWSSSGGGGGGGAILIAASGVVNITGTLKANGGNSGRTTGHSCHSSGSGGGGSGGAIRVIASEIKGAGTIQAAGGTTGIAFKPGGAGSHGRIRLEADTMNWSTQTIPPPSIGAPSPVFVPNLPGVSITSVGGIAAPASPSGFNDIVLPDNTPNPIAIQFATTDVPTGGIIKLTATPVAGSKVTVNSTAITGTLENGTASANINLPNGPNLLIATATFLVTADLGMDFSKYAMGEEVKEVQISYVPGQGSITTFIAASGNEYPWPSVSAAIN